MVNRCEQREVCFACGRDISGKPHEVITADDLRVYVGPDCYRNIRASGMKGFQPPSGGPRLYT
jgi:ribosome-binding protein aMBF1 (putative translation factor)